MPLGQMLENKFSQFKAGFDTFYVGKVIEFNSETGLSKVQPMMVDVFPSEDRPVDDQDSIYPPIQGVLCNSIQVGSYAIPPTYTPEDYVLVGVTKASPKSSLKNRYAVANTLPFNLGNSVILCSLNPTPPRVKDKLPIYRAGKKILEISDTECEFTFGDTKIKMSKDGIEVTGGDVIADEVLVGDIPLSTHGHKIPSGTAGDPDGVIQPNPPPPTPPE